MISIQLSALQSLLNGQLLGADVTIASVSTDSRHIEPAGLFIALQGERFDGHDFVATAEQNGACALLVSHPVASQLPQLVVADTLVALGLLGAWVKAQAGVKTIALTGSCGKTTVKEMLAAILSRKGLTLATAGNFNNHIGVPLTLLNLTPAHQFAVIELGANHEGEIAYTTALVKPDIALVTNLAAAHLEGFGSLAGVTRAKGEIFQGLSAKGVAIVNLDSWGADSWQAVLSTKQVVHCSASNAADVWASNPRLQPDGCYHFELMSAQGVITIALPLPGKHQIANAVLAAAAALATNSVTLEDIARGFATLTAVKGRGAVSFPRQGLRVIDDSYNASLAAMKSAIDLLDSFDNEKLIVLADMAEMGEHTKQVHLEVAQHLAASKIQHLVTFGAASKAISAHCHGQHFTDKKALIAQVVAMTKSKPNLSVLVKGANSMKMWEIVSAIEEAAKC